MAIDFAPEFGTKFTLTGPDGSIAVFNDKLDANYVGMLTNITGLDSAEVRESGDALVEFDGGVQGPGYYGRRPVVLEGLVYGHTSAQERATRLAKLAKATNSMRGDSTLSWTPTVNSAVPVYLKLRRQQPLRVDGGWNKTFQAGMVAADPRVYGSALRTASCLPPTFASIFPQHEGYSVAWPLYSIVGPVTNPVLTNYGAAADGSSKLSFSVVLTATEMLSVDTLNRTIKKGTIKPATRVNRATDPTFEGGTTSGFTAGTAAVVANFGSTGSKAMRLTRSSGTPVTSETKLLITGLTAGQYVTAGFEHIANAAGQIGKPSINFYFYNSGGGSVGSPIGVNVNDANLYVGSTWKRLAGSALIPATATQCEVFFSFQAINHTAAATDYLIDRVVVEAATVPTDGSYFSGAEAPTDYTVAWNGTVNASQSTATRVGTPLNPAAPITNLYSALDFPVSTWDGLSPGLNTITATGTWTSTSALVAEWRDTWL